MGSFWTLAPLAQSGKWRSPGWESKEEGLCPCLVLWEAPGPAPTTLGDKESQVIWKGYRAGGLPRTVLLQALPHVLFMGREEVGASIPFYGWGN